MIGNMISKNLILWIFLAGTMVSAQVSFKAIPDKTTAKVGEKIQLSFIITTSQDVEIDQITFPGFAGFQMLGRNTSQNFNYSNGRTTRQYMETVVLLAQKQGRITINPASIVVNGKKIQSNPVTFTITKANTRKSNQGNELVFMNLTLSQDQVYPNQPVIAEIKLFARSFDALRRRSELEVPGMSDFQVIPLSKNQERDFEQVFVDNQVYVSEKIAEFQLIPKSTGELVIPPFNLRVAIPLDFFEEKIVAVSTKATTMTIRPFPENAPRSFTGAVGNFKFKTNIDKNELSSNESINYEIELIGEGNFSSIRIPQITVPGEIEIYSPKSRKAYQTTAKGEKGKLVDSYVLVPQYGGDFQINPIEFTFFNPSTEEYTTINTEKQLVKVEGESIDDVEEENKISQDDTIAKNTIQKTIDLIPDLPKEISGIFNSEKSDTQVMEDHQKSSSWWYWLTLIPIAAMGIWWFTRKKKVTSKKVKDPNHITQVFDYKPIIRNDLYQLKQFSNQNDRKAFLDQSQKLLNDIVVFVQKEQRIYDVTEARKILSEKKSDRFANRWETLYNQTQMMKYGVVNEDTELEKQYDTIAALIKDLIK